MFPREPRPQARGSRGPGRVSEPLVTVGRSQGAGEGPARGGAAGRGGRRAWLCAKPGSQRGAVGVGGILGERRTARATNPLPQSGSSQRGSTGGGHGSPLGREVPVIRPHAGQRGEVDQRVPEGEGCSVPECGMGAPRKTDPASRQILRGGSRVLGDTRGATGAPRRGIWCGGTHPGGCRGPGEGGRSRRPQLHVGEPGRC